MAVTLGTADAVLKEIYEGKVQRQLNDETPILQMIESSSNGVQHEGNVGGRFVSFPIHVSRNTGLGARREMEDLPLPGNQGYIRAQIGLKYLYARIQLSGPVVALADSNTQAFVSVLDDEVTRIASDAAVDLNRQVWSLGNGQLGATSTATTTATATITNSDVRNFQLGMYVDVHTAAGFAANVAGTPTAAKASVYVSSVNPDANTITLSAAVAFANGDIFTRNGNVAREITSLPQIIKDTGVLFNVDPAVQPLWKSVRDHASGTPRPVSESLMRQLIDKVRTNGGRTNLIIMPLGVSRAYANLLQQNRQVVNTTTLTGGYSSLAFTTTYGDVKIMDDWTAPPGKMWGLNTRDLTLYQDEDWHWWKRDGGMWRWVQNKDAQDAFLVRYLELAAHRRNTHWVIEDLVEG